MKIYSILLVLLIAVGCSPRSGTSKFALTATAPAGLSDAQREAWKVERMVESARFRALAFGGEVRFRTTKVELRVDRSKMRVEVFVSDPSKETALEAARAYAGTATRVLELKRAEFEISPLLDVVVGSVEVSGS